MAAGIEGTKLDAGNEGGSSGAKQTETEGEVMARKITMIPPTISLATKQKIDMEVKRRVAGYARVSTDSDEQFTSYEAQVDYYTKYIKSHADWEFVAVYTDEGISGLSTKKRSGFNQMVTDALAGRFTLIVTKSVSRFARNTVDSLSTIRKLKDASFPHRGNLFSQLAAV